MNYNLNPEIENTGRFISFRSLVALFSYVKREQQKLIVAFFVAILAAGMSLVSPVLIGYVVDAFIQKGDFGGVVRYSSILLGVYIMAFVFGYLQAKLTGSIGQRLLFALRNDLFKKIQELPVDFFKQNRTGDLISRINNDTEKINLFLSQTLMEFSRSILLMIGSAILLLSINFKLGVVAIAPSLLLWIMTILLSPWVKRLNANSMKSISVLSSEVQESLNKFDVVVAFNRQDYFRDIFDQANQLNYRSSVAAGIANNLFVPIYTFFSHLSHFSVLLMGINLVSRGEFTIGLLISFFSYVTFFYNPLHQIASLWGNFQMAIASWERVSELLHMKSNLPLLKKDERRDDFPLLKFQNVSFQYFNGKTVLNEVDFHLERGKSYAFVGPTGGGKTTTASLIARLYDPQIGQIFLDGYDIRSFKSEELAHKIGFILQDPFLFSGTILENIFYGNKQFENITKKEALEILATSGLGTILERFENGLDTVVGPSDAGVSMGQRQLIAFIRAILRKSELLILDEATANIDTLTGKLLEEILELLPPETTRVTIAHRFSTIAGADEIFFINSGRVVSAGSLDHAIDMLMEEKRNS